MCPVNLPHSALVVCLLFKYSSITGHIVILAMGTYRSYSLSMQLNCFEWFFVSVIDEAIVKLSQKKFSAVVRRFDLVLPEEIQFATHRTYDAE